MSNSDSDEDFNFQSKADFEAEQEEKETMISNDHHFKILSEICDTFYDNLEKSDYFNHKSAWRTFSNIEPIKLKINSIETLPGICDIVKPSGNFYHKVLIALGTIILEIDNLLPNIGVTNYESLYGLSIYGEEIDTGESEKSNQNDEVQISRILPYLNEIKDKIYKLLTIAINLIKQLASLYSEKNNPNYHTAYKFYTFDLAFEYLGKILSYFLAIDTIVQGNDYIKESWDKYRTLLHQVKNNLSEFNMTEEQRKKLDKLVKKINASIFDNTCYKQCIQIILQRSGEVSPTGTGIKPLNTCTIFNQNLNKFLSSKIKTIYSNLNTMTESYEPIQLFHYLSLFGFYLTLNPNAEIKSLLKAVWQVQKKISFIPLVGISSFNIESFLNTFKEFRNMNLEPSNVSKHVKSELNTFEKQLPYLINTYNVKTITWTTKMETFFYDSKTFSKNKKSNNELLIDSGTKKAKLIIEGLCIANYLRKNISNILETHLNFSIQLTQELINSITSGLELIKVIESEFSKLMSVIGLNLNILNRALLSPIQIILKKVAEYAQKKVKDGKSTNEELYKNALSGCTIFYACSQAVQSELRLVIEKLILSSIEAKEMLDESSLKTLNENLWMLEQINQLSREIKRCTDCSFLYLYQNILPTSFKYIYGDRPKRLYYFMMAVNDIEKPLYYIKYKENNGIEMIKLLRKTTFETFEGYFLKKLAKEIEDDLRIQVHSSFIEGLESAPYSDNNFNTYLNIKSFKFFDKVISIRRYIEEHLNMNFYKLTTLNLNNSQTYQQMRVLAKHKYGLNLHEVILPKQNLEQGKDILDIIRNLGKFTKSYTHNMHSQIFIEINSDSNYINIIGVQQIINSLYTHGKGIINSIINKAFGYISKTIRSLLSILFDDYILSLLKDERLFWDQNKQTIKYNYPLERAMSLRQKIINLDENKYINNITKSIQFITQIGNAVALSRCIRAALMDYNSQNVNLLTSYNINDFKNLVQQLILQVKSDPVNPNTTISPNMLNNTQNSLNDSNKIFCDMISSLKQTGENEINYLEVLVSAFGGNLTPEKVPDIDLFAFLLPPLTITFIDNAINARDNLLKKNKSEETAYFSDDGFMMGVCYLLKIFSADKKFESLSWFPSVISYYNSKKIQRKNEKGSHGVDTLNERQITSYKEQFELQYFTYTSAAILFNE